MTDGVFIRSMATRGHSGGLAVAVPGALRLFAASGYDPAIVETVGVGQDEIEVVKTADLVMMVCIPGQGDGIQALKAGVMEIADLYVINKADQPGADEVMADIQAMLELSAETGYPIPPVFKTSALKNQGIKDLVTTLLTDPAEKNKQQFRREIQVKEEILCLMESEVFCRIRRQLEDSGKLDQAVGQMIDKKKDPYSIVTEMLRQEI